MNTAHTGFKRPLFLRLQPLIHRQPKQFLDFLDRVVHTGGGDETRNRVRNA
jgi:hypothetical protein